jgi:3-isopropylmalate/(R)-2-methylmalate dehydratase small subunit
VISSFFADIFRNNSLNNGLLPVVLPEADVQNLLNLVMKAPGTIVKLNLAEKRLEIASTGKTFTFDINPYKQECLINGLDDIDYLLSMKKNILEYEEMKGV